MTDILSIDTNPKTVKGQKHGYMTAIVYLSPYKSSGQNVCAMAELAECWLPCLNISGHGAIASDEFNPHGIPLPDNAIQRARLWRTNLYNYDRPKYMEMVVYEIERFIRKAERKGLVPVIRLNGTSDIQFERGHPCRRNGTDYNSIFEAFPDVQLYDYTKRANRFNRTLPANYHLSLSYSGASDRYKLICMAAKQAHNCNLVVVVRNNKIKESAIANGGIDGDSHDLRFLDKPGAIVYLKAKGRAVRDKSGFVLDSPL